MKKIILININRGPHQDGLLDIHRLLTVQTAHVNLIPSPGTKFIPVTKLGKSQEFKCLKVDSEDNPVQDHEAIVYTEISRHITDPT